MHQTNTNPEGQAIEGLASPHELGATLLPDGTCHFLVWAPEIERLDIRLLGKPERVVRMRRQSSGYHHAEVDKVQPGTRYLLRLGEGRERPDPVSRFQPEGVHGPSEIVSPRFDWSDQSWRGLPLRDYVIYELHVGTFTAEGTFEAVIPRLAELRELGITALELMPVAQFPGGRNWGYDGVGLFAVQNSYGGPAGLKKLVDACHAEGIAVVLDVVYNHLGPEGNYLAEFGPYFTTNYTTPWGAALNFDGPHSSEVRRFFIQNALHWHREYHIDALRLDAVHSIRDFSATPFLQEMARAAGRQAVRLNRPFHLIAENDLNNPRFALPETLGGMGLDAQWSDDFHHCLHVLLTGERRGYYQDFGGVGRLAKVWREGYAYTGEYSAHRKARHGASARLLNPRQFVVCAQNHDQIGNRAAGERLTALVDFESLKLAAGAVLLSPFIPLLFMGEEYAETAPFQYITSHSDADLIEAVRKGRKAEFASFEWKGEVPDPQDEATFARSRLDHSLKQSGRHRQMLEFYRELLRVRREKRLLLEVEKEGIQVQSFEQEEILAAIYSGVDARPLLLLLSFAKGQADMSVQLPDGIWKRVIDSTLPQWGGKGPSLPETFESRDGARLSPAPRSISFYQLH